MQNRFYCFRLMLPSLVLVEQKKFGSGLKFCSPVMLFEAGSYRTSQPMVPGTRVVVGEIL